MENSKSWPQKGDKYFFVSDDLCVGHGTVTDDIYSDAYWRQEARFYAGNFFQTFGQAKKAEKQMRRKMAKDGELVCRNCWLYPCFKGIDTMRSNLAETCRSWHKKSVK